MSRQTSDPAFAYEWQEKLHSGEYLRKFRGYDPELIGGLYSESLNIGEDKFGNCVDFFSEIGDVSWWIKSELDKLSTEQMFELITICEYKKYIKEKINFEKISLISKLYGCKNFHVNRTGDKQILQFINIINEFRNNILQSSKGCLDDSTIDFKNSKNDFEIKTFEEFKNDIFNKLITNYLSNEK